MGNELSQFDGTVSGTSLERWLGRREAFGLVAGRCSAAEVECVREIRDKKLYLEVSDNWDEFCPKYLKISRRKADTAIRQLEEHGRQFFHVTQTLRITEAEYVTLKEHMTEDGLKIGGEIIPWTPENSERITQEVTKLRASVKPGRRASGIDLVLERFQALNDQLEKAPVVIEDRQRKALGDVLLRLSSLAARRGVVLVLR